ncbi:MAG: ABC transporter ATP-binding protein [Ilumatobacter sp.]
MTSPTRSERIVVTGISRTHRRGPERVLAVDDISFELEPGRITALVGPSGSGKTTVVNIVVGADRPEAGTVIGVPDPPTWDRLAFVPQQLGLLEELSLRENVEMPLRRLSATTFGDLSDTIDAQLGRLGLTEVAHRRPPETSLGQQQRAAIARALVGAAGIVVADEPTSHQDEANVTSIGEALRSAARTGAIVFVATHDQRLVEQCDAVISLRDGRRVAL